MDLLNKLSKCVALTALLGLVIFTTGCSQDAGTDGDAVVDPAINLGAPEAGSTTGDSTTGGGTDVPEETGDEPAPAEEASDDPAPAEEAAEEKKEEAADDK